MNFFKCSKLIRAQKPLFQIRDLKRWEGTPPPEVAIGTLSLLLASIASIRQHGKHVHPNFLFICQHFWLNSVHPSHLNKEWGQTIHGLPTIGKEIFYNMYPSQPDDKFITWEQMKVLYKASADTLQYTHGIPLHHGAPSIQKKNQEFEIALDNTVINTPLKTHFYAYSKKPREHNFTGIPQRHVSEIYQMDFDAIPSDLDIIIYGGGLSVYWVAKHLATPSTTRRIICLKHQNDELKSNTPSNSSVDLSRIIVINVEESTMSFVKEDPRLVVIKNKNHSNDIVGLFYSAIGLTSDDSIVAQVPSSQVTSHKNWTPREWISAGNIPVGSLMESILEWFSITDNLEWAFEPLSYHEQNSPLFSLTNSNPSMDIKYFNALKIAIKKLKNPVPESQSKSFLMQVYQDTYNPTHQQIALFEKALDELLAQRINMAYNQKDHSNHTDFFY